MLVKMNSLRYVLPRTNGCEMARQIRLSVDVGGTFTDVVLETDEGLTAMKVLTTPAEPEKGLIEGVTKILESAGLGIGDVSTFIHGTTLATNAILERRGARTGLIATAGFRDVIEIGTESRYDQYELALKRPEPLVERPFRVTVAERMDARGNVVLPMDEAAVRRAAGRLVDAGVESVAVCFLHSYVNGDHEMRCRDILAEIAPHLAVSLSSEVCPEIREYERTSTTIANAYVQPLIASYLKRLEGWLHAAGFRGFFCLMTSSGGLCSINSARLFPVRLVESGPAGGAIFAAVVAAQSDEKQTIAFDMGGTTAKVTLISEFQAHMAREFEVDRAARFLKGSGLPIRIPVIEMIEIGAGGGSIASVDNLQRLRVGPQSASSVPGPVCYDLGGAEPTVTDADAVMGLIDPATFSGGTVRLDINKARSAIAERVGVPLNLEAAAAAHGIYDVVCENMASAARVHAAECGATLEKFTMIAFGGAAPLHAARVAEKIGIDRVIIPRNAGVGSAIGFLSAPLSFQSTRSHYTILDDSDFSGAEKVLEEMAIEILALLKQGAGGQELRQKRIAYMRYIGQGHEIAVELPDGPLARESSAALRNSYEATYRKLYKRVIPDARIEVLAWSVTISTVPPAQSVMVRDVTARERISSTLHTVYDGRQQAEIRVPFHHSTNLDAGDLIPGPALIGERETTVFVPANFVATIDSVSSIVLRRHPQ